MCYTSAFHVVYQHLRSMDYSRLAKTHHIRYAHDSVDRLAWSPDGSKLASIGHRAEDGKDVHGIVRVLTPVLSELSNCCVFFDSYLSELEDLVWDLHGTRLLIGENTKLWTLDPTCQLINMVQVNRLRPMECPIRCTTRFPGTNDLVISGQAHGFHMHSFDNGHLCTVRPGCDPDVTGSTALPDGSGFLTGDQSGTVTCWDRLGTPVWHRHPDQRNIIQICAGPDQLIATVGCDGSCKLWSAQNDQAVCIRDPHDPIISAALSPDGTILATGCWTSLSFWDRQGTLLHRIDDPPSGTTMHMVWSPDGTKLAVAKDFNLVVYSQPEY